MLYAFCGLSTKLRLILVKRKGLRMKRNVKKLNLSWNLDKQMPKMIATKWDYWNIPDKECDFLNWMIKLDTFKPIGNSCSWSWVKGFLWVECGDNVCKHNWKNWGYGQKETTEKPWNDQLIIGAFQVISAHMQANESSLMALLFSCCFFSWTPSHCFVIIVWLMN